jgi:hypothetical protein
MIKKNKVTGKEEEIIETPIYSEKEINYRGRLLEEMYNARNLREQPHDEFDGMTYTQYCESNRKLANAYITPKKNKTDTNYVSGSVRQKMTAVLSMLNNMSLIPEVMAFNEDVVQEVSLGKGVEDIIFKTDTLDNDDEKKLARQFTLLEQGTVFVEECWYTKYIYEKELEKPFDGKINNFNYIERRKKIDSLPTRNILVPENVFLGDITQPDIRKQPFIFTVEQMPFLEAESIYGTWERWQYVTRDVKYFSQPPVSTEYNQNWSLTELKKDHVEIVKYQNRYRNEYTIFINGVLMTPFGLPLPRKWGDEPEYNITSQILWLIDPHFAYGKSLGSIMRGKESLLNEFLRSAVTKTQLSFNPARANLSGYTLSSKMFMPGVITNGLDADKVKILGESNGMTKSELAMIQEIQKGMEDDVPSNGLSAKNPIGVDRITATQSQNIKTQSEVLITLTVFAATLLEMKVGTLRMYNILENWFEPIGEKLVIDNAKQYLINKYRKISVDKMIEGEGPGQSIIDVTTEVTNPLSVYREEEKIKKKTGKPVRINKINPDIIKYGKHTWYIVVNQKVKKTSDLAKVLFGEMLDRAVATFGPKVNMEHMSERFAAVWGEDPTKMFIGQAPIAEPTEKMKPAGARGSVINKSMTEAGKPTVKNLMG